MAEAIATTICENERSVSKLLLVAFAVIAAVAADVSHLPSNEYLPPVQEAAPVQVAAPVNEYLPPVQAAPIQAAPVEVAPAHELADDGYRYKTHRRVVYRRHRRDVNELPSNEYLPPVQEYAQVAAPSNEYLAPAAETVLADDGYRYKTQRRTVIRRHRRDVSHLPSNEYLPPVQESVAVAAPSNEYLPPVQAAPIQAAPIQAAPIQAAPIQAAPIQISAPVEAAPAHVLADDGYRYKTHRRVVYRRHRRDVNELPSNEYLPPVQEYSEVAAPSNEYLAPAAETVLADDGYRYKTQRRVVIRRHRRDVSHLPSNEYLPPVQESVAVAAPSNEYLAPVQTAPIQAAPIQAAPIQISAPVEVAPAHELADDGYRYKTHRRVVYRRHRRDVNELPSNEYLPPVQEYAQVAAPSNEYLAPAAETVLADDGYRYKTQRRTVIRRHRRDVSHLPSNEYLPPVQESVAVAAPSNEYLPPVQAAPIQAAPIQAAPIQAAPIQISAPVEAAPAHVLADDGYRYKTHRRVVYRRHRRDVNELPSNEYLPPVQEYSEVAVPSNEYLAPQQSAVLADDGYRYKTQRRVVLRRHAADVSHLPSNQYLPPNRHVGAASAPAASYAAPSYSTAASDVAPAHTFSANDGYRYKSRRRVVLRRHRRGAPSSDYLPPFQGAASAPSSEYLPPAASAPAPSYEAAPVADYSADSYDSAASAPAATYSANDGYRYKTQRRRVIRRRKY
ncbi:proline-rich extensin-like protein EPR1 [Scaptodrosophila lebanonensis]|uniref:Proline-rich extensin-like protein EPR1 n=1 Tax=Drosophila lebanonensis TaxID=7225 RepID=A0A6J2T613_DROLE|nr:proline-rich extensin-like protein EPR1 [Scaptodrosophila lebanonensis]